MNGSAPEARIARDVIEDLSRRTQTGIVVRNVFGVITAEHLGGEVLYSPLDPDPEMIEGGTISTWLRIAERCGLVRSCTDLWSRGAGGPACHHWGGIERSVPRFRDGELDRLFLVCGPAGMKLPEVTGPAGDAVNAVVMAGFAELQPRKTGFLLRPTGRLRSVDASGPRAG